MPRGNLWGCQPPDPKNREPHHRDGEQRDIRKVLVHEGVEPNPGPEQLKSCAKSINLLRIVACALHFSGAGLQHDMNAKAMAMSEKPRHHAAVSVDMTECLGALCSLLVLSAVIYMATRPCRRRREEREGLFKHDQVKEDKIHNCAEGHRRNRSKNEVVKRTRKDWNEATAGRRRRSKIRLATRSRRGRKADCIILNGGRQYGESSTRYAVEALTIGGRRYTRKEEKCEKTNTGGTKMRQEQQES